MIEHEKFDAIVVGGGPAGLCAAVGLARTGIATALAGPPPSAGETRTAALLGGSVDHLRAIGAWARIGDEAEPLKAIRIVDDTGDLLRAPEVLFKASEVGREVFGYNVPNKVIVERLRSLALELPNLTLIETPGVAAVEPRRDAVVVTLPEGRELTAPVVIGADGRNSICRKAAGIEAETWTYDQSAVTCTFAHGRPHHGISTELHRRPGPMTVVPSPGLTSSLVWVERPEEARRLAALDEDAFRAILEERLQGLLGTIGKLGPRGVFPLSGLAAKSFGRNRILLVGEAGHVLPPIGAQGLNLGFADAAAAVELLSQAWAAGRDLGTADIMERYSAARHRDVTSRAVGVDILNRSLLSSLVPVRLARGLGLIALGSIPPLKRLAIRAGLGMAFAGPGEASRSAATTAG